jgi:hypothetical protein
MNLVEDCPELFMAENPIEWAFEHLTHLQSGTAASIFQHPSRDDVVIRVTDYPDGWFMLADDIAQLQQDDEKPSPFLPVAHWIGQVGGVWIGAAEKLEEITADHPLAAIVDTICNMWGKGDPESWNEVETVLPGFNEFRDTLRLNLDVRETNFMRRGDTLVFNDPYSNIPHAIEPRLRETYAVDIPERSYSLI